MNTKILILLSFPVFLAPNGVIGQVVTEVQQSLITERTATWCPYCGSWGWNFFEALQATTSAKAVLIAAHFGGSTLENPASIDFVNNLGGSSQPKFFVNNELQNVTSANTADALVVIQGKVNDNYLLAPVANVGMETNLNEGNLELKAKTRFFQPVNGSFYLGLYLVEDDVLAAQASQPGLVEHQRILRAALTPSTFGDLLADGVVDAGLEFTQTYPVPLLGYDLEKLDIVGIIWKQEAGKFMVVNVWAIDAKPVVTSSGDLPTCGIRVSLWPNPVRDVNPTLSISLANPSDLFIELGDSQGRFAGRIFEGTLPAGAHELEIDPDLIRTAGWYSVRISSPDGEVDVLPLIVH